MQNYTVIIASAYGDDSADIYVVLAPSPKAACDHVQALDAKLKDRPRSVLFLMDGEVRFQPTLFKDDGKPQYEGPTVIDLRPAWSQEPPVVSPPPRRAKHSLTASREPAGVQVGRMVGAPLPEGTSHGGAQAAKETPLVSAGGQTVRRQRRKAAEPAQEAPPAPPAAPEPPAGNPHAHGTRRARRGHKATPGSTSLISGKPRRGKRSPSTGKGT